MAKTVTVDRVKVIAEMARQNLTGEELAQKAGTGNSAIYKCARVSPSGAPLPSTFPVLLASLWKV